MKHDPQPYDNTVYQPGYQEVNLFSFQFVEILFPSFIVQVETEEWRNQNMVMKDEMKNSDRSDTEGPMPRGRLI